MKITLCFVLQVACLCAFADGSKLEFDHGPDNKARIKSGDTVNLSLPLSITFAKTFLGKTISVADAGNQTLAARLEFGKGDLLANPDKTFTYIIQKNKKTNPGDFLVDAARIRLVLDKEAFALVFAAEPVQPGAGGSATVSPQAEDKYVAGYIYYDAMALADAKTIPQKKAEILKAYGVTDANIATNPYLKELISVNIQGGFLSGLSSAGGADVTYFAAGLARFLAERTREELSEAFFRKMKEQVNAYPELSTLFPKTCSFLNTIESYSYASLIQVLKEAFETDMENLPENQYQLKNLNKASCGAIAGSKSKKACEDRMDTLKAFFDTRHGKWIALGMFTVKEAVSATNPAELLTALKESKELDQIKTFADSRGFVADYNICSAIDLSELISHSLISKEPRQLWINQKELQALLSSEKALKAYLGLLLALEKTAEPKDKVVVTFKNRAKRDTTLGDVLIGIYKTNSEFEKYKPQVKELLKNASAAFQSANSAVRKMITAMEQASVADPQALYDYYTTFAAALRPIAHSTLLNEVTGTDIAAAYDGIEMYVTPAVDMAYHISVKRYSAAVYDAVQLLNNTKTPVLEKRVAKSFIKYGTLISTVATAKSSEEVKNAIEASVLPVGSSAVKRYSKWSITANAYVGAYWGWAYTKVLDTVRMANKLDTVTRSFSNKTFGLYAPVGLSFSRGILPGWGSVTLSAQIIDVGALVNFYMLKGNNAALPADFRIKLADIVAPGLQIGFDIPKTPISVFYGRQYVPWLYKSGQIESGSGSFRPITWRDHISIVVDIPLYNLKVSDYKKH